MPDWDFESIMINIIDKSKCCGCNACAQRCPKQCISLHEDSEGFLYPKVNQSACIDCGLCEKVCPVLHQNEPRKPLHVYAAINKNEKIRRESSSGGIFTALAEKIIKNGGVVFGARFDENWEVKHDYTETIEGLSALRGSKYVQSRMEDNYQKAETFLKEDRKVLFSGTPCQIAALKRFLQKEYDNLLTVDFICHGVPSPKVWRMYLKDTCGKILEESGKNTVFSAFTSGEVNSCIEAISFRNKNLGWKKYSFFLKLNPDYIKGEKNTAGLFEPLNSNSYLRGFIRNIFLRPSCHQCPAKCFKSQSDITLGDFWGCNIFYPDLDDDKGVSLVFTHNNKYPSYNLHIKQLETTLEKAINQNPAIVKSCKVRKNRQLFMDKLEKYELTYLIDKYSKWDIGEGLRLITINALVKLRLLSLIKTILRK